MLARLGELTALVLDFVEQPHVLDRDCGLVGEGLNQLDLLVGEGAHLGAGQGEHADRHALAQHRYTEGRANPGSSQVKRIILIGLYIRDMNRAAFEQRTSGDIAPFRFDQHTSHTLHEFGLEPV